MPAIIKVSPEQLKQILILWGYKVAYSDEFNWIMEEDIPDSKKEPIVIPCDPGEDECVSYDILTSVLMDANLDHPNYFALRRKVVGEEPEHKA